MSLHSAKIEWSRKDSPFIDNRYSRAHSWTFDGGVVVPASSSPHSVRVPFSNPANVDPEEAYVAALSSCHMLWFLSLAAAEKVVVNQYTDQAEGRMEEDARGKVVITQVTFHPQIEFAGERRPDEALVQHIHHAAHEACFLANSVRTEIVIDGGWTYRD